MKKKILFSMLAVVFLTLWASAGSASAHVVVYPREVSPGTYEKFAVRVPTEKDSSTVKVEVRIPEGVNITRFEPKPDWTYELERDDTGKIVKVAWSATGPGFGPTEFGEFYMQGRVADDAADLVWNAWQTYADGEVVAWTGPAEADRPASVTKVAAPGAGGAGETGSPGGTVAGIVSLVLSISAFVLSLLALIVAVRGCRAGGTGQGTA